MSAWSGEGPLPGRRLVFLAWQKGKGALWGLPVLPEATPPNTIISRLGFQHMNLVVGGRWGAQK